VRSSFAFCAILRKEFCETDPHGDKITKISTLLSANLIKVHKEVEKK
jgi:hypothetical protein